MQEDEVRRVVLETLELYLESQIHALRELKGKTPSAVGRAFRGGRRRQSLVDMSLEILTELQRPLHVGELVEVLRERFGRITDRDALSSALAKKARQGILFEQTAPATFRAIDSGEKDR